jgi:predicted kinase
MLRMSIENNEPSVRSIQGASVYRALILTGIAGVGKTTVADAVGGILSTAGCTTAVVDTDMLAQFGPAPPGWPAGGFHDELKCINLAAVWANFRAAGARVIVVAAGIDSAALRARYAASLADCEVRVVRLTAGADTVRQRLYQRDTGDKLERHLRALDAGEPTPDVLVADFTVPNDRPAVVVARDVLDRSGWSGLAG